MDDQHAHGDQHALVVGHGVVHGDEVGMIERRPEPRLAVEALRDVLGAVGVQALDRHAAAEALVLGEVDGRHAPGAESAQDAIAVRKAERPCRSRHP